VEAFRSSVPFGYTPVWAEKDKYNVKHAPAPGQRPVRIGLIGLGGVALGKHLPAIRRLQETGCSIQVTAAAEINDALRAKCQSLHGFHCYADFEEMLEREELDAVELLTDPGESRLKALRAAVARGVHLLVEKPFLFLGVPRLDESIAEARTIVAEARKKQLVVMTGFMKHFSPPYVVAQQLIQAGEIGTPSLIALKLCQGWSRHILLEGQACHNLHIVHWIGGTITGLHAFGINRFAEPNYPYDNIVVNVEFESGAIGAFYFNSSSPSLKPWERIEVFGDRKWLVVEDGYSVTLHDSEEGPSKTWAPVLPHTLFFDEEFAGYAGEIRAFADAIREKRDAPVTGEDGIEALVLARMIHASIEGRRYIRRSDIIS
jgi:predicted dehydrogenase